ncbi:GroES-like protein [Schizopora paradoxa]|uniref:GroES-like protein n=1 Tax=Schizopora paradoxa TaxID=27342 RepID=A0A0H2QYF0_9AGAM|nr:GroES-like protein [Schizopora paradoxa]
MKAAVVQEDKTVKVAEKAVPKLQPNEILLKTVSVGLNPTDWKHVKNFSRPGDIVGCDFVGKVVEIGSEVPVGEIKEGEVRWGFTRGGVDGERGGFAEYVAVDWDLSSVVPSNVTPQEASSIPIPFLTSVQALYIHLGVPEPPEKVSGEPWILIWSGFTAVGRYAIQLAKLSGFKVATTASEKNWAKLKEYGADVVFDYKDPDVVKKLKEATGDKIEYGFDCISEKGSVQLSQQAFRPEGGRLILLLPTPSESELPRPDVKTSTTLAYMMLGTPIQWGKITLPAQPEDRACFVRWTKITTELFAKGAIKPLDVHVVGDLDKIQEALDMLQSGKHSTKLVLNVS